MKWYKELYLGAEAGKIKNRVLFKVSHGGFINGIYLITLPTNPANVLEIVPSWNLRFPYLRKHCPMIVGIAKGYDEAANLAASIISESYQSINSVNVKEYLITKNKRKERKHRV